MTYQDAVTWLYTQLPMYQKVGKTAFKKDLTNTLRLLEELGNPHIDLNCIHVAGTIVKCATRHILSSILVSAGYKTGLYTSPHLKDFSERIQINNQTILEDEVTSFVAVMQEKAKKIHPSFFEMTNCSSSNVWFGDLAHLDG